MKLKPPLPDTNSGQCPTLFMLSNNFGCRAGDKFVYTYDMNSNWEHEVRVEAWRERQPRKRYPGCIGGHGGCPPENCGGPPGYDEAKAEASGLEATDDLPTIADFVDRIVLQKQPELLYDPDTREQLEAAVEHHQLRAPFLDRFEQRKVNERLRAGDHHVLKYQQFC